MKKLGKLSLKQMADEMPVIGSDKQREMFGGYFNDCFWRCVSYVEGGGGTEADTESHANQYYYYALSCCGMSASDYYNSNSNGAGMYTADIQNYIGMRVSQNTYSFANSGQGYIGRFNVNNISDYQNTGNMHAVVITCVNPDGSGEYYDPQTGTSGTIPASQMSFVERAMY